MPEYGIIVGDPIYAATKKLIPDATGYKVDYPASFAKDSKAKGAADVLKHLTEASKACPQQNYVLIGYSQGADVMHQAAAQISPDLYPRIVALVMFGDPGNKGPSAKSPMGGTVPKFPAPLAGKVKENCAKGDPVCTNSGKEVNDHLVYYETKFDYMSSSAEYIKKQFETKGKAGASPSPNGGENDKGDNTAALLELGKQLGGDPAQLAQMAQAAKGRSRLM
jgi:cutinase